MDDKGTVRHSTGEQQTIRTEHETASHSGEQPLKKSTDEKNFRQLYYQKVGLGNDEEKIAALLNPVVDIDKIRMYIKTYSIPDAHRLKIWKLLLGMTTSKGDDHYTSDLRKTSYDNLNQCLTVLGRLNDCTSPVDRNVIIYKFEDDKMFHPKNFVVSSNRFLLLSSKTSHFSRRLLMRFTLVTNRR